MRQRKILLCDSDNGRPVLNALVARGQTVVYAHFMECLSGSLSLYDGEWSAGHSLATFDLIVVAPCLESNCSGLKLIELSRNYGVPAIAIGGDSDWRDRARRAGAVRIYTRDRLIEAIGDNLLDEPGVLPEPR